MMRIEGRSVVLERLVMRNVVSHRCAGDVHVGAAANRGPVRTPRGWSEASLEPPPGDPVVVQEIAHVATPHLNRAVGWIDAVVVSRTRISNDRVVDNVPDGDRLANHASGMGLPSDQIERSRCRRTKDRIVGVVVHREVLRVIPEPGDGVAIVVAHYHRWPNSVVAALAASSYKLHEFVHQPVVHRALLILVVVA